MVGRSKSWWDITLPVGLVALLAGGCAGHGTENGVEEEEMEPGWSVDEPLYTDEQADWGRELFVRNCSHCHEVADFTSSSFLFGWGNGSVADLHRFVSTRMPFDNPGRLDANEYLAILAHILRLNRMPAGNRELGAEDQDLTEIRLERGSFFD